MSKHFTKVDLMDVKIFWICNNKKCDDYGTITTIYPICNEKLICETCDEKLDLDHIEVAKGE